MDAILKKFRAAIRRVRDIRALLHQDYDVLRQRTEVLVQHQMPIRPLVEHYLIYSTIASLFLSQLLFRRGIDVFLGYPIVIFNTCILMALNRLLIHRNHAIFVGLVMLVSLYAARRSGTPEFSVLMQILGIMVFSVYYFSVLTTSGLSIPRWMEIYTKAALLIAVWGIIDYFGRSLGILPQNAWPRLHSILQEPSFFVYLTLPAIGIYLNAHMRRGGYGMELAIFIASYVFADSSLGFLGLMLAAFLVYLPRLNIWRMFGFAALATGAVTAVFVLSANFRLRVVDTVVAIGVNDLVGLQHVNASTFAVLANAYVTIMTFIKHPFIGVGIGGYQFQYVQYLPMLSNDDANVVTLNMYDAASLYFRTAAELGAFGLTFLFGFLLVCSRVRGDVHVDIRNAVLPFLLLRMARYGAYFSLDFFFFVGIYFLNYMHYRSQLKAGAPGLEPAYAV